MNTAEKGVNSLYPSFFTLCLLCHFFVFTLSFIIAKRGLNPSLALDFSRLCFLCQRSQIVNRYSLYSKDGFESLLIFFTCHPSWNKLRLSQFFFQIFLLTVTSIWRSNPLPYKSLELLHDGHDVWSFVCSLNTTLLMQEPESLVKL